MTLINDLINPESLPDHTEKISLVQTNTSFVIIEDNFVYKIKKAVNLVGFLDYSTTEKRRYFCQKEIDLTRRLCDDLFSDVPPFCLDGFYYQIGEGRGKIVDYAVKMKRIPENMIMKYLFENGLLTTEHVVKISSKMALFHMHAKHSDKIAIFGDTESFRIITDENFQQTEKYRDITISKKDFEHIKRWTDDFYRLNRQVFHDHIKRNMIRDFHGDLNMEHICLTESHPMFDCIEFNDRFRYTDILADDAFLLMDSEYRSGTDFVDKRYIVYQ